MPSNNKRSIAEPTAKVNANDDSVKRHFSTFYLEDGSGKVVLDAMKAYEHV